MSFASHITRFCPPADQASGHAMISCRLRVYLSGCIVFVLLLLICCCLCLRSRRSTRTGGAAPGRYGGLGPFGRFGRSGAGNGAVGPGAQEAGYGTGPGAGPQSTWNNSTQPAYGGQYQPPTGPPPTAPQPGGFAPVSTTISGTQ